MYRSGSISLNEFFDLLHEKRTTFGNEIFRLLDTDDNGELDFSEFCVTTFKFAFFGKDDMRKFCFNIFDQDKNGTIDETELKDMAKMLHHNGISTNLKSALYNFETETRNTITYEEYFKMCKMFPTLLHPAFHIQESLQHYTLGRKFFRDIAQQKRIANEKEQRKTSRENKRNMKHQAKQKRKEARKEKRRRKKEDREKGLTNMIGCCCCAYDANKVDPNDFVENKKKGSADEQTGPQSRKQLSLNTFKEPKALKSIDEIESSYEAPRGVTRSQFRREQRSKMFLRRQNRKKEAKVGIESKFGSYDYKSSPKTRSRRDYR